MSVRVTRQRIVGSAAALGVLLGGPFTPFIAGFGRLWWLAAIIAAAVVLVLGLVAGRLLWATAWGQTTVTLLGSGFFATTAAVASFIASYAIAIDHSLCGKDGAGTPTAASVALVATYCVIGLWGFQHPRRLPWAWPLAIVVAFALSLAITAALPSGHGYCET
jgi:hypothetical protein